MEVDVVTDGKMEGKKKLPSEGEREEMGEICRWLNDRMP